VDAHSHDRVARPAYFFFFLHASAPYLPLSLHDALPIWLETAITTAEAAGVAPDAICVDPGIGFGKTVAHNLTLLKRLDAFRSLGDRKSTRLNSSHVPTSSAAFCLTNKNAQLSRCD